MNGVQLIAKERRRQIKVEGWTPDHDNTHWDGELAEAAACYARQSAIRISLEGFRLTMGRTYTWPWDRKFWKPTPKNRIRELVKAGALIAAEIDRLQRHAVRKKGAQ